MVDVVKLKETIMSIIRIEGPVLPVNISRKLGSDTYFAGAVLSELVKSKAVKITNAKIGGSPLYYINGQESKLDRLFPYLPGKEKEAYELLRTRQVLRDSECEPAIRVALRSIKDFSMPLDINNEVYWRWYLTNEDDARNLILEVKKEDKIKLIKEKVEVQKELTEKKIRDDEFLDMVVNILKSRNINLMETNVIRKNKEIEGKIKVNSDLGVLDYYLLAKSKKSLNEADLSLANDKGRKNKLPVLFLGNGRLTKKAEKYLEENLKGRVIFKKI